MADNALVLLRAHHLQVRHVDAKALEEAGIAQHVDRDVVLVDVEHADMGVSGLVAKLGLGPLADQEAGFEVVGREGHVLRVLVGERGVERNDQHAASAGLLQRRADRVVRRGDQDALGAAGKAVFNGGDLRRGVAVLHAGKGLQLDAGFLGLGFRTFLHFHEEGVGVVLGDEAGADVGGLGCAGHGESESGG